jgi:hypothetical protein
VQWIEYANEAYFASGAKLAAADASAFFIGSYTTGFYLNPLIANNIALDPSMPHNLHSYF